MFVSWQPTRLGQHVKRVGFLGHHRRTSLSVSLQDSLSVLRSAEQAGNLKHAEGQSSATVPKQHERKVALSLFLFIKYSWTHKGAQSLASQLQRRRPISHENCSLFYLNMALFWLSFGNLPFWEKDRNVPTIVWETTGFVEHKLINKFKVQSSIFEILASLNPTFPNITITKKNDQQIDAVSKMPIKQKVTVLYSLWSQPAKYLWKLRNKNNNATIIIKNVFYKQTLTFAKASF